MCQRKVSGMHTEFSRLCEMSYEILTQLLLYSSTRGHGHCRGLHLHRIVANRKRECLSTFFFSTPDMLLSRGDPVLVQRTRVQRTKKQESSVFDIHVSFLLIAFTLHYTHTQTHFISLDTTDAFLSYVT